MAKKITIKADATEGWKPLIRDATAEAIEQVLVAVASKMNFNGNFPMVRLFLGDIRIGNAKNDSCVILSLAGSKTIMNLSSKNSCLKLNTGIDFAPIPTAFYAAFAMVQFISVENNNKLPRRKRLSNPITDMIIQRSGIIAKSVIKELFDMDINIT